MNQPRLRLASRLPCLSLALLLAAPPAAAQVVSGGFSAARHEPAERGSDWFALDSLDLRGKGRPALGLTLDWARKPLVLYGDDGDEQTAIVKDQVFAHLGASIVVAHRLRFGLNLPIAAVSSGSSGTLDGVGYPKPDGGGLGDVRLAADARLTGAAGEPFTLGLGAAVWLPTGSRESYTGDGRVRFAPRLQAAGDVEMIAWAARLGVLLRREVEGAVALGNALDAAVAAGVRALDGRLLLGPELVVGSSFDDFLASKGTPVDLLFGAHLGLGSGWRLGAAVGPGLSQGPGTPAVRVLASVDWFAPLPPPDRDRDGIVDGEDACPDTPGPRAGDPRTNGCPPPPDTDGDGIADPQDACPKVKGFPSSDPRTNGCPPPPPPDTDKDGIVDGADACPDKPGVANADPKKHGCPPDRDNDGFPDAEDACPEVIGVASPDPKKHGCPADKDGDGIPDAQDACPEISGPSDPDPKKHGCPPARIEERQIKILEQVKFQTRSARILPSSDGIITAVADILKGHPEIRMVRIEGHTDNVGGQAFNKRLSQQRAAAVMKALVGKGIDRKRMRAVGHGLERPIDDNATEAGRQNNRRVEFHIEEGR